MFNSLFKGLSRILTGTLIAPFKKYRYNNTFTINANKVGNTRFNKSGDIRRTLTHNDDLDKAPYFYPPSKDYYGL